MCKNFIKLFVLSCIFVLLLGLSCQSYASFETKDIYNLIYNYYVNSSGYTDTYAKELVNTNKQNIENHLSSYVDNDNYNLFVETESNTIYIQITNNNSANRYRNSSFYVTSVAKINYNVSNNSITLLSGNSNENRGSISSPYWTNQSFTLNYGTDIYWSGIHNSPSWFTISGPYDVPDAVWEFVPAPNDYLYLSLDNENKFYKLSKTMNYLDLGTLADSVYTGSVITQYYFYNKSRDDWDFYLSLDDFSAWAGQNIGEVYTTNVIDDIMYSYIAAKSKNVTENVIIDLVIAPYDNQPVDEGLNCWFYVVGPHTVINSGDNTVNVTDTFNDDYYNDYIDGLTDIVDNPTNSLLNAITDLNKTLTDDSEIPSIIDSYFSGDSGDLYRKLGYVDYDNPFQDNIYTVLMGCKDVLLGTGHVVLDLNHHGSSNLYIDSDDIYVPYGALKVFISAAFVFLFIWGYLKMFFYWVRLITTFDLFGLKQLVRDSAWIAKFF